MIFDRFFKPYAEYCLRTTLSEDELKTSLDKELPGYFIASVKAVFGKEKVPFCRTWNPLILCPVLRGMKTSNLLPMLSALFSVLLAVFCSGCCSYMVWQETGKVTTHVEETRADFTRPGELTVQMTGWQETAYLPWWPMGHDPWKETVPLPLDRLPDRKIGLPWDETFYMTTIDELRFHKTESGLWSMARHQGNSVHPDDIPHLSEPYIKPCDWPEWDKWLMIPLEVRESKDEYGKRVVHVRRYWAFTVHFPGHKVARNMEGVGITIWKCCLMPIPIVLDAATFPIQAFIWFGFLYKGPCGGGLLTN